LSSEQITVQETTSPELAVAASSEKSLARPAVGPLHLHDARNRTARSVATLFGAGSLSIITADIRPSAILPMTVRRARVLLPHSRRTKLAHRDGPPLQQAASLGWRERTRCGRGVRS